MKAVLYWPILLGVVVADFFTKYLAESLLGAVPHSVIGDNVRLVLVYNPGAAFGLYLGDYSRWIFMVLTFGALFILQRLYTHTEANDTRRTLAIAFVSSGAIGNLIDRLRTERGVVDFIDIGFGSHRWPTFNIADIAVSGGALLLAIVLWNEDKRAELAAAGAAGSTDNLAGTSASASASAVATAPSSSAPRTSGDAGEHS